MVCFSDAIDPSTLKAGLAFLPLDRSRAPIAANQIFYDPASKCAFARPDQVLNQQSRYLFTVTDAVQDSDGHKVKQSKEFKDCLKSGPGSYCGQLSQAVNAANENQDGKLVAASLFTTMSATDWLERARNFVNAAQPPVILPAGAVSVFQLSSLNSLTWLPQDNSGSNPPTSQSIPLSALQNVDSVAFGMFLSPNFLNVSGPLAGSITPTATNSPIAPVPVPGLPPMLPSGYVPISFHVFLPPASKMPAGGFPVVIYGHGLGDNQFGAPTFIASTLAAQGIATLALEIQGHGFGPGGVVQATDKNNNTFTVSTPGRGIAFSAGPIGATDGCILPGALAVRDCARQSAVNLFALVATIRETAGLGYLNANRIYYVGQSFGSTYGTLFHAVEPAVSAAVINAGGGTSVDVARLAISGRPLGTEYLASVNPALLNVPPAPSAPYFHDAFNDNYPFRDLPAVTNNVTAAPALQAAFEAADWLGMPGDPLAYAQHLQVSPLTGVAAKQTLFQFGYGDLEVPNPTESALVRAAGAQATTWMLRFDAAAQAHPELLGVFMPGVPFPILPHRFLSNPTIFTVPAEGSIAVAAQRQVADFFLGNPNPDPNRYLSAPLFQNAPPLPEQLNFIQIPR